MGGEHGDRDESGIDTGVGVRASGPPSPRLAGPPGLGRGRWGAAGRSGDARGRRAGRGGAPARATAMSGAEPASRGRPTPAEVVALVIWVSASAALASSLYPAQAAALFTFLVGLVVVVTLRATITFGLAMAAFAAVLFAAVHLALSAGSADPRPGHLDLQGLLARPTSREGGVWAGTIIAVVVLMVSSLLADVVSAATARLAAGGPAPAPEPRQGPLPRSRVDGRELGLLKAEWELARAATYRRRLTLGLIGPDPEAEPPGAAMEALDRLLGDTLTAFDVICAYGPWERLMVMPEEPCERVVAGAEQLCEVAGARLGRPVRMSVAGFPEDGSTLPDLLRHLDRWLGRCREGGATLGPDRPSSSGAGTVEEPTPPVVPAPEEPPDVLPPTPASVAARAPAADLEGEGEIEVLEPLELPADPVEAPAAEEELRILLQDPWSTLEAEEEQRTVVRTNPPRRA